MTGRAKSAWPFLFANSAAKTAGILLIPKVAEQYSYYTRTSYLSDTPECEIKEIAVTEFHD